MTQTRRECVRSRDAAEQETRIAPSIGLARHPDRRRVSGLALTCLCLLDFAGGERLFTLARHGIGLIGRSCIQGGLAALPVDNSDLGHFAWREAERVQQLAQRQPLLKPALFMGQQYTGRRQVGMGAVVRQIGQRVKSAINWLGSGRFVAALVEFGDLERTVERGIRHRELAHLGHKISGGAFSHRDIRHSGIL